MQKSKKKKYLERIFNVHYSFTLNYLFKKENFVANFYKFLSQSAKNPLLSLKYILKKLYEKFHFKKFIFNIW